jgi:adenylate cyclase
MPKEIERKFLLASGAWRSLVARRRLMSQGYIANTGRVSVRVRVSDGEAWLNIKHGGLEPVRDEYEYPIPLDHARALLESVAEQPIVEKTRHWVPYAGVEWEIDEFHGQNEGLIVAEIELTHEQQRFARPPWLGKEVTRQSRYYNVSLVRHPYARWSNEEREP